MESFTRSSLTFPVLDTPPSGPSGGPSSGTVVLLHGFPQGPSSWDMVSPQLAEAGYRVLAPTLRGYAESNRPAG